MRTSTNRTSRCRIAGLGALLLLALTVPSQAQLTIELPPGAAGSDGELSAATLVPGINEIDLRDAVDAEWDSVSPMGGGPGLLGSGVYDATVWAVVIKLSYIDIPTGTTVRFINHDSRAPVVLLVDGTVNIDGVIELNGSNGPTTSGLFGAPGPGGFRGGIADNNGGEINSYSAGYGPGGGSRSNTTPPLAEGGSHRLNGQWVDFDLLGEIDRTYGNPNLIPLLGGSGGSAGYNTIANGLAGGGGGGAILIAARETMTINGTVQANGGAGASSGAPTGSQRGGGGGAGGAIRLIATEVSGTGTIAASGGPGGTGDHDGGDGSPGRVRIEAFLPGSNFNLPSGAEVGAPDTPVTVWPPADAPTIEVIDIEGWGAPPPDPSASLVREAADVFLHTAGPVTVTLRTSNIDPATVEVKLRLVHRRGIGGRESFVTATLATVPPASFASADWTAVINTLPDDQVYSVIGIVRPLPSP